MLTEATGNQFEFGPLEPLTVKDSVAQRIRAAILAGALAPGSRIIETKLARQLDVAQSTVREAMQELVNQGLLTKRVNRDTMVRKLSTSDLEKLFAVRVDLEGLAIELAHSNVDEKALAPLFETVEQMRRAARVRNRPEFYRFDMRFHWQVSRLSNNEFLERALIPMSVAPIAFVLVGSPFPSERFYAQVAEQHVEILDSFKEKTPKEARRVVEAKLREWHELQMRSHRDVQ